MQKILLLVAALLLSAFGLKSFKNEEIPKSYPFGLITNLDVASEGRLFFMTQSKVMGIIDQKSGKVDKVYILQQDEKFVEERQREQMFISKGKSLNMFAPSEDNYVRSPYSKFLEEQNFSQIICFKRYFAYDYILTNEFLLKAKNPLDNLNPYEVDISQEFSILSRKGEGQIYWGLVFLGDKNPKKIGVGLVTINNNKELCISKFAVDDTKGNKKCFKQQTEEKILEILTFGQLYVLIYETKKLALTSEMKIASPQQSAMIMRIINAMSIGQIGDMSKDGKTLMFYNKYLHFGSSDNIQIYQNSILVKKKDKVIVTIKKKEEDVVKNVWAHTNQNYKLLFLAIQLTDGKIKAFEIDEQKKQYTELWAIKFEDYRQFQGGSVVKAEDINLKSIEAALEQKRKEKEEKMTEDLNEQGQNSKTNTP